MSFVIFGSRSRCDEDTDLSLSSIAASSLSRRLFTVKEKQINENNLYYVLSNTEVLAATTAVFHGSFAVNF